MLRTYPVIEFDPDKTAIINPSDGAKRHSNIKMSEKLIITFFHEQITKLLEEGIIYDTNIRIPGENIVKVYQFKESDTQIVLGIIGCPACAGFFEDFIAYGVKKVMFCGGGGVLVKDISVGKYIVITEAIRDEGFSYHYIEPSRTIKSDPKIVEHICSFLKKKKISYIKGMTWTTDCFYRETKKKVEQFRDEGAIVVEMEQAGMIAVATFRNVQYGAIIYGGDDLSQEQYDGREWYSRIDCRRSLILDCKEIVERM